MFEFDDDPPLCDHCHPVNGRHCYQMKATDWPIFERYIKAQVESIEAERNRPEFDTVASIELRARCTKELKEARVAYWRTQAVKANKRRVS